MKKAVAILISAGVVFSAWLLYSGHEARLADARAAQAKRDAAYNLALEKFQRDLPLGIPRSKVEEYLESRKFQYGKQIWDIDVVIGQDPGDVLFCDRWNVYSEFHFTHLGGQTDPSPLDNLDSISIKKRGHCL